MKKKNHSINGSVVPGIPLLHDTYVESEWNEERYKAFLDSIEDGCYELDLAGNLTFFNSKLIDITGYTAEEMMGKNFKEYTEAEGSLNLFKAFNNIFMTGLPSKGMEWVLIRKEGLKVYVESSVTLIKDSCSRPTGFRGIVRDISERKRSETALEESEALQRILLDNLPAGVIIVDPVTRIIERVNDHVADLFGASVDHLVGHRCHLLLCPANEGSCPVCDLGMTVDNSDREMLRNDGSRLSILKTVKRIQLNGQEKLLECFVDLSRLKQAEEALTKSEIRFRTLYESSNDAVMLLDQDGFLDCNTSTLRMFGCIDKATFCSKHPADFSPTKQPCGTNSMDLAKQRIMTAMETGSNRFEWIHKRIDTEKEFPCEVLLSSMSLDGQPVVQATVRDITERKRSEEALSQSEKRFRLVAQSANDAFMTFDSNSSILFWNVMAEKMFGYKEEDALGKSITTILSPRFRDEFTTVITMSINAMKKVMNSNYTTMGRTTQMMGLRKDGHEFPIEISTSIWEADGKYLCTSIIRDITERKGLEDSLRREAEELKRARIEREKAYIELQTTHTHVLQQEKMASIGQLAAGVAHEINNPMGFISSNLGTLKKYLDKNSEYMTAMERLVDQVLDKPAIKELKEKRKALKIDFISEDIKDLINESLDGADRVKKIVQDLKSFSRVDQAEYKHTNINECMETTINIVWNELKYKATVNREYGEIPLTKCYAQQLNQVFMNLLVNASQAIEKQGVITVRTWKEDSFIFVSITDTGCGMEPGIVNRIFEPFFTTKEVGQGTGLGLSITYDIVKKHGGEITVQSIPGEETTFTIRIPIVDEILDGKTSPQTTC